MPECESSRQSNRHGLPRYIPAGVKRMVRNRCGYGCVICGSIIYEYHHLNPPFRYATEHDPDGIVLLCGTCHIKAEKGLLSDATIKAKSMSPKCLEQGFATFSLDVGEKFPVVILGKTIFIGNPTIIRAFGRRLLFIEQPEEDGGPCRISATFYDKDGKKACSIERNEWQGFTSNWDIRNKLKEFTVLSGKGEIALRMKHLANENELVIDRLNMYYKGFRINMNTTGRITTYLPDGRMGFQLTGACFVGNKAVIEIG